MDLPDHFHEQRHRRQPANEFCARRFWCPEDNRASGDRFLLHSWGNFYAHCYLLVGPNFGLPGFQPNNPSVLDVVITFTVSASMSAGVQTFNLVLDTANTGTGGLANFFSQDKVATGVLAGTPNAAQQNITTPTGISVPDGGATAGLLGAALLGLGLLRKKLGQTS